MCKYRFNNFNPNITDSSCQAILSKHDLPKTVQFGSSGLEAERKRTDRAFMMDYEVEHPRASGGGVRQRGATEVRAGWRLAG
jgi:hypothetical protein